MRSLRSRLILGFSLVAVVPLALAMILLAQRVQSTVRKQAAERLSAALGMLQVELRSDGERTHQKLEILVRDPALKRLYLLRPAGGRDLSDYLVEKRILLGLDFLDVAEPSGIVIADASFPSPDPSGAAGGVPGLGTTHDRVMDGPRIESLDGRPAMALAAGAPIRYQGDTVAVVRGGLLLDAAFLARLKRTSGMELVVRDAGGRVVATTLAAGVEPALPLGDEAARVELGGQSYLSQSFPLAAGPGSQPRIAGLVSTASADQTIVALRVTSLLLGLLGLGIAIVLGVIWSLQISRPVEQLAVFSQKIAHGQWDEPLTLRSVRELETLVSAFERMRGDLATYREKLVLSERQAAWSQMARTVAHEIKNPLTPIAVSVADLKRSFDQQRPDFSEILDQAVRTVSQEVETLKHLLQEFSDFARFPRPQFATCRLSDLLADLGTLYAGDIGGGRVILAAGGDDPVFTADRGQLRQALVNLIQNGLEAVAGSGRVTVSAGVEGQALEIAVADTGPGLTAEERVHLFVPDFTTKPTGSGLGLTIVERIVGDHQGTIAVVSAPGRGTTFHLRLPLPREN